MAEMDTEEILRELQGDEDDREYYTLLNVSDDADQDEIRRAYRRLCRIYHPDRYQDAKKQEAATEFFRRIQEAYKVLSDPRARQIYDRRGWVGLNEDKAVIERTSLPSELLDEYEKLRELWEERSYIQDCNPSGDFRMVLDATPLIDEDEYVQSSISVEEFRAQQSVDATITKSAFGQVVGVVLAPRREPMFGGLQFSLRQLYSDQNWVKLSALIGSRPGLGFDAYHVFSSGMYFTSNVSVSLVGNRGISYGTSSSVTRRLSDSTTGSITVHDLGRVASVKISHQLTPTTSVLGETSVGEGLSYVKGLVYYQPLSHYLLKAGVQAGTKGVDVLYGIEHTVAKMTTIGSMVSIGPTQGVVLKLKLQRAAMNFHLKIRLSDFVSAAAIFYATSLPLVLYGCIRALAIAPMLRREWVKEIREKRSTRVREMLEKKKEAEAAIELMQETVERIVKTEQAKHGLLIFEAWYGKLFDHQNNETTLETKVIDVRVPLQCLVIDSKLILRESGKASVPGFYDPCIGERKYLLVKYKFRGVAHEVTVENSEPLLIPRESHRVLNHSEP